jgi:hypothetical protein
MLFINESFTFYQAEAFKFAFYGAQISKTVYFRGIPHKYKNKQDVESFEKKSIV